MTDARLIDIRRKYGNVYTTTFPDGLLIPWRSLTIGEYLQYDADIHRLFHPPATLENEVFLKCVVDPEITKNIDQFPAGVVTTVVRNIWEFSGPVDTESMSQDFMTARQQIQESRQAIFYQCAQFITTAFPYTIEEINAMDYQTFLLRLAQAEHKMLQIGQITEPLQIAPLTPTVSKFQNLNPPKPKIDAKAAWEQHQQSQRHHAPVSQTGKWWKVSPVLEAKSPKRINFEQEQSIMDESFLDSHERNEKADMKRLIIDQKTAKKRAEMIQDAQVIYRDLIQRLQNSPKR